MEELKDYITALKLIRESERLKVSDECLFEQACGFLRGKLAGENKRFYSGDKGSSPSKSKTYHSPSPDSKPTQKQLDYLNGHSINYDEKTLTKREAIQLIGKHKSSGAKTI